MPPNYVDHPTTMADEAVHEPLPDHVITAIPPPDPVGVFPTVDILDIAEPTKQMKAEMRMAVKPPSEWLRLLCPEWSQENQEIVTATDTRFLNYKSYLKGQLTSQLLCRLSSKSSDGSSEYTNPSSSQGFDFWKILGVEDEFDRCHIVANIDRFCSLYNIRGSPNDDSYESVNPNNNVASNLTNNITNNLTNATYFPETVPVDPTAAAAGLNGANNLLYPIDPNATASIASMSIPPNGRKIRQSYKGQQRRLKAEMREREREAYTVRKAAEKAARAASREERRQRKLTMRKQREDFAQKQKEAALRRAADLVHSNRVPIEITRGASAAQAAANAAVANAAVPAAERAVPSSPVEPPKKGRSSIVISTASDLDQIVTHSNNLWAKYNAIAKEHNQKVNWIVVAKELGIHVKVREKYARMHARAKSRGFDFVNWGHYRIKDYPHYFLDPMGPVEEQKVSEALRGNPIQDADVGSPAPVDAEMHPIPNHEIVTLAAEAAAAEVAGAGHVEHNHSGIAEEHTFTTGGEVYAPMVEIKHEDNLEKEHPTISPEVELTLPGTEHVENMNEIKHSEPTYVDHLEV